jgi:hypothetical protein
VVVFGLWLGHRLFKRCQASTCSPPLSPTSSEGTRVLASSMLCGCRLVTAAVSKSISPRALHSSRSCPVTAWLLKPPKRFAYAKVFSNVLLRLVLWLAGEQVEGWCKV